MKVSNANNCGKCKSGRRWGKLRFFSLRRRLLRHGFSRHDVGVILQNEANPKRHRDCYPYERGILKIKELISAVEGPTILSLEGGLQCGKSTLSRLLADGRKLGLPSSRIGSLHEDVVSRRVIGIGKTEEAARIILLVKELAQVLGTNKQLIIYDGHYFSDGYWTVSGVYENSIPLLKGYNVLRATVDLVLNKDGRALVHDGRFLRRTFGDSEVERSLVRHISIADKPFFQFAREK